MKIKIIDIDVIDNCCEIENSEMYQISEISVLVQFEFNKDSYYLDFQSTVENQEYSSVMWPYGETNDYKKLEAFFDNETKFFDFIEEVKTEANVQQVRDNYIAEHYIVVANNKATKI